MIELRFDIFDISCTCFFITQKLHLTYILLLFNIFKLNLKQYDSYLLILTKYSYFKTLKGRNLYITDLKTPFR
ncbi:hypothetical protein NBO_6g0064 [Nosema bombycis CQ1]|uniref:Uncharacterized protein n=1 Tax=Nosema bombycis (strain CQ1 / CVCC 102059) TaxID=578461 RepID=R0MR05_NOSB1|nr:hypothetical protein NBO_6g0064 [Nosema bombycis CQ1]|eukprot:EOB15313.1 hypothetical protein NBO_6g0064 [Nosema bombycis CQ1]